MIELSTLEALDQELKKRVDEDGKILEQMREDVRPLKGMTRRIQPRSATAISLVGTDGGNNQLRFDPFTIQLVRVVDSSQNEYCLEVITPSVSIDELSKRHIALDGAPKTALGRMIKFLGKSHLRDLSPVFDPSDGIVSNMWMDVYREMTEWAVLAELVSKPFGSDTVIVCDGFLRSKMFKGDLFARYRAWLENCILRQFEQSRRRIYVCGVAKKSSVIQKYRIAMALEGVLRNAYPCYLDVPEKIETAVYKWDEYVKRTDRFVSGKMFLVKFGSGPHDPIWAMDILISQKGEAQTILGYLLEDAKDGFPIPLFPQCLQKAHENAALIDFDMDILQDKIVAALRANLGEKKWIIDELALQDADPAAVRYS